MRRVCEAALEKGISKAPNPDAPRVAGRRGFYSSSWKVTVSEAANGAAVGPMPGASSACGPVNVAVRRHQKLRTPV